MGLSEKFALKAVAAVLALGVAGVTLAAQPDIRPGLWEMKPQNIQGFGDVDMAKMQKAMEQMKSQLAMLPPEQRKMMEEQMAGAMNMSISKNGGFQVCLTKELIQQNSVPVSDGDCQYKVKEQSKTRWAATITCKAPAVSGEAVANFSNPKAYQVSVRGSVTERGKTMPYNVTVDWKHVSDSCGNVKPIQHK